VWSLRDLKFGGIGANFEGEILSDRHLLLAEFEPNRRLFTSNPNFIETASSGRCHALT
jgi:hypothetical protein